MVEIGRQRNIVVGDRRWPAQTERQTLVKHINNPEQNLLAMAVIFGLVLV